MSNNNNHIKIFRYIILIGFVLFSLSPCTLKKVVYQSINSDYTIPLNKSKTTTQTGNCSYSQQENLQTSIAKKVKINKQIRLIDFLNKEYLEVDSAKTHNNYSKTSSGNSPPKYILYKRLKIDIAET